ncbi:dipeptide epimerase [Vibrio sp.]|nr:dipeptide epimerase [Vibrio sp.]
MEYQVYHHPIQLARPFKISRGSRTHCDLVRIEIQYNGDTVIGECTPYPRYGESVESVIIQIKEMMTHIQSLSPNEAKDKLQTFSAGAARNAVDCALWRLIALLNHSTFPVPYFTIDSQIETAMTVSVGDCDTMYQQALEYVNLGAILLKVKLDSYDVIERVSAVRRAAPLAKIILDANEAWNDLDLEETFNDLKPFNITMIEQPVSAGQDQLLHNIPHPIPLCADESCHTLDDLDNLVNYYEMINIKLDKTGGLTGALELESRARDLGMSIMVGCMLGTSLSMKAALPIATRADVVDLDGPVLLGSDHDDSLIYQDGLMML